MVLGDYPRGRNRARIADLANGNPPLTQQEVEENHVNVNTNNLTLTRALQEARGQFNNAFLKPGYFFSAKTDWGALHKKSEYSAVVTQEIGRTMKRSVAYYEAQRSKFGLLALHGIAPAVWENESKWCTKPLGVEDVLIPAGTLLGFDNLPFYVLRRSFTALEMQRLTLPDKRDPGWRMPLVKKSIRWADDQMTQLMGTNWPEIWAPEKWSERMKEGGFYASDQVPTIDCFDIYAYDNSDGEEGWIRRIIFDTWGSPSQSGLMGGRSSYTMGRNDTKQDLYPKAQGDFLFNSGTRKVAPSWQNLIAFQFSDLSAVAPFRYHSVRSLGFLLFAVCHLQNRLDCKFSEAVFESLMMLFRVKTMDDVQRALKIDMVNKGFIDDSIQPVPAAERWQPNANLIELGISRNERQIADSTGAYAQRKDFNRDNKEKTRYQVMAEVNAQTALISSALSQAYQYQQFEDREIFRRFLRKNSRDLEVVQTRANILKRGVPEKLLCPEPWDVEHERVMGGGNKTMEMTIAQQLMEWRELLDPEPQRIVLRNAITAVTDDPAQAKELVPEKPVKITDAVHDAQLSAGTLMQGLPVGVKTGVNHIEIIETLLVELEFLVQGAQAASQKGQMPTPERLQGFQNIAKHIVEHVQILAQNEKEKPRVKRYMDALKRIMNVVKALGQQLMQAMQKQAQADNGHIDPEAKAKIESEKLKAQAKVQNARESHADKTAQRRISFEQKSKQDQEKQAMQMQMEQQKAALELRKETAKAALDIHTTRLKSLASDDGNDE